MVKPEQANQFAEALITDYVSRCGCQSEEEFSKAMEMLSSSASRAIEKYAGFETALAVLERTAGQMVMNPQL